MRILFVENHALFATTVVEQFLSSHEVTIVPSVAHGIDALASGDYDVVLVDYDLDDEKGDQLIRHIRRSNIRIPVVAVSAHDDGNQRMVDAGADAVCRKQAFKQIEPAILRAREINAPPSRKESLVPIDVPFRFDSEPLLWSVDGVYTAAECAAFIRLIEGSRPELATNNALYRDQDRVIRDDPAIADDLLRRLRPHLPPRMGELVLCGLNSRLRMYRYRAGQRFAPHMDHWYRPSDTQITLHSVLVYFNDDFAGGETRFQEQLDALVVPAPGRVAIFQHKLRHEGCPVARGTKYAMRTDVLYGSPGGEILSLSTSPS